MDSCSPSPEVSTPKSSKCSFAEFVLPDDFPLLPPPPSRELPHVQLTNQAKGTGGIQMESAFKLAGLPVPRFETKEDYIKHLQLKLDQLSKNPVSKQQKKEPCKIEDHFQQTTLTAEMGLIDEFDDEFLQLAKYSLENNYVDIFPTENAVLLETECLPSETEVVVENDLEAMEELKNIVPTKVEEETQTSTFEVNFDLED